MFLSFSSDSDIAVTSAQPAYNPFALRFRYYDSTIGQFTSLDPLEGDHQNPLDLNKYLYCDADPINRIDPAGTMSLSEISINISSTLSNFSRTAGTVFRVYQTVSNFVDFIETVQTILGIATGGLQPIIDAVKQVATRAAFGQFADVFSEKGIKRAAADLIENLDRVGLELIEHPAKLQAIGRKLAGANPVFVILLPTLPGVNILYGVPPIPTGIKLGRLRIPVYLGFGRESDTGRFVGFGVFDNYKRDKHFDQNVETLFHMDYGVHFKPRSEWTKNNVAYWNSADNRFEFQIPRPGL